MAAVVAPRSSQPQAFISSYAPRLRAYGNSLLAPVFPQTTQIPTGRTTKRGTTAINYAEDFEDDDQDDSEGPRRFTGLRSRQKEDPSIEKVGAAAQPGKELKEPIEVQGIWRDWMGKPKRGLTEKQLQVQSALPLTLIPIRIDLDIASFRPEAPLPTPQNARDFGIDENLPAYKQPEPTPAYRLKDTFLWNLHEALITPDQFAKVFVDELDFPLERKPAMVSQIATQIRTQLEEYAGVALHPLFHSTNPSNGVVANSALPVQPVRSTLSRDQSSTPAPANGFLLNAPTSTFATPRATSPAGPNGITASAKPIPSEDLLNPDDTYRCIINLSINLMNRLYTDKFEWSLLHPPGFAEIFAKQTCADIGLSGEWVPAMTHAIYEAVLRLKKEACENGGLVSGYGEIENEAAEGAEAGWRYDPEHLADEWEPKVEVLSKEEIEKREGDRERQIRRLRRETARFSSTANMSGGVPQGQGDYFGNQEAQDQPMGRGERSKKKRRFRSLSPVGRETPDATAGYGGGGGLSDL
ncbi:MAG: hypothetical protein Q9165_003462 [Trypethelium subeluteriae]